MTDVVISSAQVGTRRTAFESLDLLSSFFFAAGTFPLSLQMWINVAKALSELIPLTNFEARMGWMGQGWKYGRGEYVIVPDSTHLRSHILTNTPLVLPGRYRAATNIYLKLRQSPDSSICVVLEKHDRDRLRVRLSLLYFHQSDSISKPTVLQWDKFASALGDQDHIAEVVLHGPRAVMKQILASILRGGGVAQAAATNKLFLDLTIIPDKLESRIRTHYPVAHFSALNILTSPEKLRADHGDIVTLAPEERAHWFLLPSKVVRQEYLHSLAVSRAVKNSGAQLPAGGRRGELDSGQALAGADIVDPNPHPPGTGESEE